MVSHESFSPKKRQDIFFCCVGFLFLIATMADAQTNNAMFLKGQDQYQKVEVEKVLAGDKVRLKTGEVIRLLGIQAPQPDKKSRPVERDQYGFVVEEESSAETSIEDEAVAFVRDLLEGKSVRLEFDVNRRSMDGENVAYLFLPDDDLFVNAEILRMGYADLHIEPPNTKYADRLRAAYREARKEQRGLLAD